MNSRIALALLALMIGSCGTQHTSNERYELPDVVTVQYVRQRLDQDAFIDPLLPESVSLVNAQVVRIGSTYQLSFFVDDVYAVTPFDKFSNRFLSVVATEDGSKPAVDLQSLGELRILNADGRLYETTLEPGKIHRMAVSIMIFYGGTPGHAGGITFASVVVDLRSVSPSFAP